MFDFWSIIRRIQYIFIMNKYNNLIIAEPQRNRQGKFPKYIKSNHWHLCIDSLFGIEHPNLYRRFVFTTKCNF